MDRKQDYNFRLTVAFAVEMPLRLAVADAMRAAYWEDWRQRWRPRTRIDDFWQDTSSSFEHLEQYMDAGLMPRVLAFANGLERRMVARGWEPGRWGPSGDREVEELRRLRSSFWGTLFRYLSLKRAVEKGHKRVNLTAMARAREDLEEEYFGLHAI